MAVRVLLFALLLAVKAVLPLAQPLDVAAAMAATDTLELDGEEDDLDPVVTTGSRPPHVELLTRAVAHEPNRPAEPPLALAERPPNA